MKSINFAQIFHQSMKRKVFLEGVAVLLMMTSCNTVVGDLAASMLEDDLQQGLDNLQKSGMKPRTSKKKTKELNQLEKEGKCMTCRGIGRSIDGKYVCPKCNGTGLALQPTTEDNNKGTQNH